MSRDIAAAAAAKDAKEAKPGIIKKPERYEPEGLDKIDHEVNFQRNLWALSVQPLRMVVRLWTAGE